MMKETIMNEERKRPFSKRQGYQTEKEITVRNDAPAWFRNGVLELMTEQDIKPSKLRKIACKIFFLEPDSYNWSEYPNVWEEVQQIIEGRQWYEVYDFIEAVCDAHDADQKLVDALNEYFRDAGVGWQLKDCQIEIRGPESFERSVHEAAQTLEAANRTTAANEFKEAIHDLSRRPDADITGAIQHAVAGLECAVREKCGDNATLGKLLNDYPDLLPKPLDEAAKKVWGYASEMARHIQEGRTPTLEEAELAVAMAASIATYITKK
jgi:hypothetical protein